MNRILFSCKGILSLLIICLVIFFDFVDLKHLNANAKMLNLLSKLDATEDSYFRFENFELLRMKWLQDEGHPAYAPYQSARTTVVQAITSIRNVSFIKVPTDDQRPSVGGDERQIQYDAKGGGSPEYDVTKIGESDNRVVLMKRIKAAVGAKEKESSNLDPMSYHTVDGSIKRFAHLAGDDSVLVLKNIDSGLLISTFRMLVQPQRVTDSIEAGINQGTGKPDDDGSWDNSEEIRPNIVVPKVEIEGLSVEAKGLVFHILYDQELPKLPSPAYMESAASYETDPNNGGTNPNNPMQMVKSSKHRLLIPVSTDTVVIPSMFFRNRFDEAVAKEMSGSKLRAISNLYGAYPCKTVEAATLDQYISRTASVSVLGFSFSRTSLFYVLTALALLFYGMIFLETRQLRNGVGNNFWALARETSAGFMIENKMSRFFLWVLSPVVLGIFTITSLVVVYPVVTTVIGVLVWGTVCFFGVRSYMWTSTASVGVSQS